MPTRSKSKEHVLVIVESPTKVPPLHDPPVGGEYEVGEDPAYIPMSGYNTSKIEVAGSRAFNLALRTRDMGGTKTT